MVRRLSLALLVLAMLTQPLAGCLGGDSGEPAPAGETAEANDTDPSSKPGSLELTDCSRQRALFPVPEDRIPATPPGFELKPFPGDASGETARVVTFVSACSNAEGNDTSRAAEGMFTLAVTPPETYREEAIDAYYLLFFAVSTSPDRVETYTSWGLPQFEEGNVSLALTGQGSPAQAGQARAAGPSIEMTIDTAVAGPAPGSGEGSARLFGTDGTSVTGALDRSLEGPTVLGPGNARLQADVPIPPEGQGFHSLAFDMELAPATGLNLSEPGGPAPHVTDATDLSPRTAHTGVSGPEPTIGVLPSGTVFVQAFQNTLRSSDGRAWSSVYNYSFETATGTEGTRDPMLWVDPSTERVYWSHMRSNRLGVYTQPDLRCTAIGWSEDAGESWERNDDACGFPVVDFQKLGGGPPGPEPNPLAGGQHPTVLYLCYQKPALAYYASHCAVSYDGGETWPVESRVAGAGLGGGRPVAAADGTVFVPVEDGIGVSRDSGLTWEVREGPEGLWLKEVAFSPNGTLYALGVQDGVAHVARSPDRGGTWEGPWRVSPSAIDTNAYYAMAVGEDGRVGVGMVGTNRSLRSPVDAPDDARWHLYLSVAEDADTSDPTFRAVRASDDLVQVGLICKNTSCQDTGARNLLDFIDATAAPDGTFYVAWADGCTDECASMADPAPEDSRDNEAAVAWLEGFRLSAGSSEEPAGDAPGGGLGSTVAR